MVLMLSTCLALCVFQLLKTKKLAQQTNGRITLHAPTQDGACFSSLLVPPREKAALACFTTPAPCGGTRQKGRRQPRSGCWSRPPGGAMEQPREGAAPQVHRSAPWQRSLHGAGAKAGAQGSPRPAPGARGTGSLLALSLLARSGTQVKAELPSETVWWSHREAMQQARQ